MYIKLFGIRFHICLFSHIFIYPITNLYKYELIFILYFEPMLLYVVVQILSALAMRALPLTAELLGIPLSLWAIIYLFLSMFLVLGLHWLL